MVRRGKGIWRWSDRKMGAKELAISRQALGGTLSLGLRSAAHLAEPFLAKNKEATYRAI